MHSKGGKFKSESYLIVDGLRVEADRVEEEVVALDGGHALRVRLVALADLAVLLFWGQIQTIQIIQMILIRF